MTAALAVQAGLPRDAALAAMTAQAAAAVGIADRVGTLAPGKDADIAVFSGHPVDLGARLLTLYVDGRLAFDARACGGQKIGEKK